MYDVVVWEGMSPPVMDGRVGEEAMSESEMVRADLSLVIERCLAGDPIAWEVMFDRFQPHLVAYIRYLMQGEGGAEQAEEIAAAVWCSLCGDDYLRLQRYDAEAGSFLRYLGLLARHEIGRWRRSARNRQARENRAARKESTLDETERGLVLQEFLETLTPREREFCVGYLLSELDPTSLRELTTVNGWKLRSRVLKKFRTYWSKNR